MEAGRILIGLRRRFYIIRNVLKLKKNNVCFGSNCRIFNSFFIDNKGEIELGNDFLMTSGGGYNPLCRNIKGMISVCSGAKLIIGNHVHVSSPCIWAKKGIYIGNDVKIGGDTLIIDSDFHSANYMDRRIGLDNMDSENAISKEIVIGDDVLIGTRCIILKGVHIGDNVIIGAGSIVVKDIPSGCIAAGNPCKIIKSNDKCYR